MNRKTRIIATIGPASDSPEQLTALIQAGMNVARINMSHANHDSVRRIVASIREASDVLGIKVAILMDTQGPAIRTGDISTELNLQEGDQIALTVRGEKSEEEYSVDVNYDDLVDDISVGDVVLVDNGVIELKVLDKKRNQLQCEVLTPGVLGSRRHINLPGVRVNLPALTEKDIKDVELGMDLEVDIFAMSFVRDADDVKRLRAILDYRGAPQKIVAKLEDQEGIGNLKEIIDAADCIMIARGDLGIECPYEELPIIQRSIVKACAAACKPVIVATHMLESMIENPAPTRAEVTDVANAVFEQADSIMLSGETSVGSYPARCIEIMIQIAVRTERSGGAGYGRETELPNNYARIVRSACGLAEGVDAAALIVFTRTGNMARNASASRTHIPIYAFTNSETLVNQLLLHRGVSPSFLDFGEDPTGNVSRAIKHLLDAGDLKAGDTVVSVTEVMDGGNQVNAIRVETA